MSERLIVNGERCSICIDEDGDGLLVTALDRDHEFQIRVPPYVEALLRQLLSERANQAGERA